MYNQPISIKTRATISKKEADFSLKTRRVPIWAFVGMDEQSWKIYKKSGYNAYKNYTNKQNTLIDIRNLNLYYSCDISYDTHYPCQNGSDCCNNDYCRCGEINNAVVNKVPSVEDLQESLGKHIDQTQISNYFFNRVYSLRKLYDPESYYVKVGRGYYGQEIDGVAIENPLFYKDVVFFLDHQKDLQAIQEYFLKEEYGYIHKKLEGKKFSIEELPLSEIEIRADRHYEKIDKSYEIDIHNVLGVVLKEEKYVFMDGYHRVKSAKIQNVEKGLFVIAL